jgi:hypothetical protein
MSRRLYSCMFIGDGGACGSVLNVSPVTRKGIVMPFKKACPKTVREIILDILSIGCLSIRQAAERGDARECAVEARHIEYLPGLLRHYEAAKLKYYLESTRVQYVKEKEKLPKASVVPYQQLWRRLSLEVA